MNNTTHALAGLSSIMGLQVVHDIDPTQLEAIFKLGFQILIGTITLIPMIKALFKKKT